MKHDIVGNLLMVSNYPSDMAYAWWLMEHFWKIQAELFDQAGRTAYLAYPKITSLSETVANSPIEPVELTIPWNSPDERHQVQKFLTDHNISYIYFVDQPYFSLKYWKIRQHGVKSIVIHDHTPGDRPPITGFRGTWKAMRNSLPWITADNVICVSDWMRRRNISNGRIPEHKCHVVQNGINPVACQNVDLQKIRQSLGISTHTTVVISTGRAHPYKRFDFIIQCAHRVAQRGHVSDVVFLLVGDGPAMPELRRMIDRFGLKQSVFLLGFREDVRELLCASDIALHAALGEGFSLSILEYMSAGLPVLVPDIPSVSQAVEHDENGFIYPQDEPDIVAGQIETLSKNQSQRQRMSKTAITMANSKYTLQQCTDKFINVIQNIYH